MFSNWSKKFKRAESVFRESNFNLEDGLQGLSTCKSKAFEISQAFSDIDNKSKMSCEKKTL